MKIPGIHPVEELLKSGRVIEKILIQNNVQSPAIKKIISISREKGIPVKFVPAAQLEKLYKGNHQGIIAFSSPVPFDDLQHLLDKSFKKTEKPLFLLLDGITDTRNFGAIIRTAAAFEVSGIIIPSHHSAPVNEDTVRMSAGALFQVPLARVNHLADAVFLLQSHGVEIIAATEKAEKTLEEYVFHNPAGILMGSENKGISKQLLKLADARLRINISQSIDSLNVSVATAIFLYEIHKQFTL